MKFSFSTKFYFFYFLVIDLREKRKGGQIQMVEEENLSEDRF